MPKTNDQTPYRYYKVKRFPDYLEGKEGQILLGAFKTILEKGVSATTIRTIAIKANLNPGIIHYYFRSKDDLLSRLLEILYECATDYMKTLFAANLSATEKIDALLERGISICRDRKDEWIVITSFWAHSMAGNNYMVTHHRKLNRRFLASVTKILEEPLSHFRFRFGNSKDIGLLMTSLMEGLAHQYVLDPQGVNPEGLINLLRDMFHSVLGQQEEKTKKSLSRTNTRQILNKL
jgi:AcrR family transcriptional regulator